MQELEVFAQKLDNVLPQLREACARARERLPEQLELYRRVL